jgi:hypothetical protein
MAWGVSVSRQGITPELEIFKLPPNEQGFRSIVVDASTIAPDADGRLKLVAGTAMSKNINNQYERFTGAAGQVCKGILSRTIEVPDNTAQSDVPAELAFHSEVFRADRIVDFATLGAQLRTALPTCLFD